MFAGTGRAEVDFWVGNFGSAKLVGQVWLYQCISECCGYFLVESRGFWSPFNPLSPLLFQVAVDLARWTLYDVLYETLGRPTDMRIRYPQCFTTGLVRAGGALIFRGALIFPVEAHDFSMNTE